MIDRKGEKPYHPVFNRISPVNSHVFVHFTLDKVTYLLNAKVRFWR